MLVIWAPSAVNRAPVGGPDERVTPLQALKAITINAASIGRRKKGSIELGKFADLVILSDIADSEPTRYATSRFLRQSRKVKRSTIK
jgi:predicted amidohydrolase YtcJ